MHKHEATALLRNALAPYAALAYPELAALVGTERRMTAVGTSGVAYQLEFQVLWDDDPGGNVRVLGSIDDGGWRALMPLTSSLLLTPDGMMEE